MSLSWGVPGVGYFGGEKFIPYLSAYTERRNQAWDFGQKQKQWKIEASGLPSPALGFALQGWLLYQVFPPPLLAGEDYSFSLPEGAPNHHCPNLRCSIKCSQQHLGHQVLFWFLPNWNWYPHLTLHGKGPSPVWWPETGCSGGGQGHKTRDRHQGHRNMQVQVGGWQWQDAENQNPKQSLCTWFEEMPPVTPTLGAGGKRQLS